MPTAPKPTNPEHPTPEELAAHAKVTRYYEHVKTLACKHENGVSFGMGHEVTCADCEEPMIFKSVVQVRNALMTAFKIGRAWAAQGGDPEKNPYEDADPRML